MAIMKHIKIKANGKSKEQLREEVIQNLEGYIDEMLSTNEEQKREKEGKLAKLVISCDEVESREGFDTNIQLDGSFQQIYAMLLCGVSQTLRTLTKDGEESAELISGFITDLVEFYLGIHPSIKKEVEENE